LVDSIGLPLSPYVIHPGPSLACPKVYRFPSIELTLFRCLYCREMSGYHNILGGWLKLKGKTLDVKKEGGVKKVKKQHHEESS
jgi:hypothetical protein